MQRFLPTLPQTLETAQAIPAWIQMHPCVRHRSWSSRKTRKGSKGQPHQGGTLPPGHSLTRVMARTDGRGGIVERLQTTGSGDHIKTGRKAGRRRHSLSNDPAAEKFLSSLPGNPASTGRGERVQRRAYHRRKSCNIVSWYPVLWCYRSKRATLCRSQ